MSFIVRPAPTYKAGWRLIRKEWNKAKDKQETHVVPKSAWPALGFHQSMTLEAARARAQQLNAQTQIKRQEDLKIARIAERVERDQLAHSAFVPEDLNQGFLKWLDENTRNDKARSHWATAKQIVIRLELRSEEFAANKGKLYKYFASQEYSIYYVNKLLRMLNLFGDFVSRISGQRFEKIPAPRAHEREAINDSYLDSDSYFGPSEPLTPDLLLDLKEKLPEQQVAWLHASLWFGLRPSELGQILEDRQNKTWRVEEEEVEVLWIYQPKLTSKPRNQRWKGIPILFGEQREALAILLSGKADKPLTKTLKKHSGIQLGLYCGRKGFTDLMLSKGQRLEDIAQWLGHSTIETTWKSYKDRRKVHFIVPKKTS